MIKHTSESVRTLLFKNSLRFLAGDGSRAEVASVSGGTGRRRAIKRRHRRRT